MWASKWVVSQLLTGYNTFSNALSVAKFRVGSDVEQNIKYKVSLVNAIKTNVNALLENKVLLLLIVIFVTAICIYSFLHQCRQKKWHILWGYLLIMLMPFVWYIVLKNHSVIHYWMTFRDLSLVIFAALMFLCQFLGEKSKNI